MSRHLEILKEDIELSFIFYDLNLKEKKLLKKLLKDIEEVIKYEKECSININYFN